MKVRNMIRYLSEFPPETDIGFIVTNPSDEIRQRYPAQEVFAIKERKINVPCICIIVGNGEDMDREAEA